MRVGFTTYPTGLQSTGGLRVHIRETLRALNTLGVEARMVNLFEESLGDFDLIHHFCLHNTSFRIVQKAQAFNRKCVVTPMVEPIRSKARLTKVRAVDTVLRQLLGTEFRTNWTDIRQGISAADFLLPLSKTEARVLQFFDPSARDRCRILPNGISVPFFQAEAGDIHARYGLPETYVLAPSTLVRYKNQLAVIRAAKRVGIKTVLLGAIADRKYFRECIAEGEDWVTYLGELSPESRDLPALFAAASMVALVSRVEPFGLVPFEALAAGTPAVLTTASGVLTGSRPPLFYRLDPEDTQGLAAAISAAVADRRSRECRDLVRDFTWDAVAQTLVSVYRHVQEGRPEKVRSDVDPLEI